MRLVLEYLDFLSRNSMKAQVLSITITIPDLPCYARLEVPVRERFSCLFFFPTHLKLQMLLVDEREK